MGSDRGLEKRQVGCFFSSRMAGFGDDRLSCADTELIRRFCWLSTVCKSRSMNKSSYGVQSGVDLLTAKYLYGVGCLCMFS